MRPSPLTLWTAATVVAYVIATVCTSIAADVINCDQLAPDDAAQCVGAIPVPMTYEECPQIAADTCPSCQAHTVCGPDPQNGPNGLPTCPTQGGQAGCEFGSVNYKSCEKTCSVATCFPAFDPICGKKNEPICRFAIKLGVGAVCINDGCVVHPTDSCSGQMCL